jgi:hypothetical protein
VASSAPILWRAPAEFAIHAVIGICMFAIIASAAVPLDLLVTTLVVHHISWMIIFGLRTAELMLLVSDLVLFLVFLWRTAGRIVKHL